MENKKKVFVCMEAIEEARDLFRKNLANELILTRASAPLYVENSTGLNDELNYVEKPVEFTISTGQKCTIVHSLAKWKRYTLGKLNDLYAAGELEKEVTGIWTNMNAIRKDEMVEDIVNSYLHSYYVDQWDWEMIIKKEDRSVEFLKEIVNRIYKVLLQTQKDLNGIYDNLFNKNQLPPEIVFITTQELEDMFPGLTPKQRENAFLKEKRAAFIIGIGHKLKSGMVHDGRAPDYDDWNLNGDLFVYSNVAGKAMELSSMGIRVDKESLVNQCKILGKENKLEFMFHKMLLDDKLPLTIGGGLGQSRICMFLLEKRHIGEVQCSVWPKELITKMKEEGINLL